MGLAVCSILTSDPPAFPVKSTGGITSHDVAVVEANPFLGLGPAAQSNKQAWRAGKRMECPGLGRQEAHGMSVPRFTAGLLGANSCVFPCMHGSFSLSKAVVIVL